MLQVKPTFIHWHANHEVSFVIVHTILHTLTTTSDMAQTLFSASLPFTFPARSSHFTPCHRHSLSLSSTTFSSNFPNSSLLVTTAQHTMPITWDATAEAKLMAAIFTICDVKVSASQLKELASVMGPGE